MQASFNFKEAYLFCRYSKSLTFFFWVYLNGLPERFLDLDLIALAWLPKRRLFTGFP